MSLSISSTIKLPSGALLPRLGFGVYLAKGQECEVAVKEALASGYRHIDSAQWYENEEQVGQAVVGSSVPRSSIFLTTKYFPTTEVLPASKVLEAARSSLKKIDPASATPSVDLFLVHGPQGGAEGRKNNWEGLVQAQKEGIAKDVGVSNFGVKHLKALPSPKPAVNQIELHPFCQQRDIVEYCKENDIIIEAYTPLMKGDKERYENPVLVKVAKKHGKEVAQVLIRWSLQKGYVPLPKSVTPSRIASNTQIYDFELDAEDIEAIDGLDQGAAGAMTWNPVNAD
ncbi:hypothetical protein IAT38_003163 [Cryptococcus sp. DSM 104549]